MHRLEQHFPFDHLSIRLYDATRNVFVLLLQIGEHIIAQEVPVNGSSLGIVLQRQEAIEAQDVETETRCPDLVELARKRGFRSFRVVPVSTGEYQLGTLGVSREQPGIFSDEDIHYLDHTAQLVALVLENALVAEVLSREKTRLEMLLDVNTTLFSNLDMHKMFREVSGLISRVVRQDFTHLALYDPIHDAMNFYVIDADKEPTVVTPERLVPLGQCPDGIAYLRGETQLDVLFPAHRRRSQAGRAGTGKSSGLLAVRG